MISPRLWLCVLCGGMFPDSGKHCDVEREEVEVLPPTVNANGAWELRYRPVNPQQLQSRQPGWSATFKL